MNKTPANGHEEDLARLTGASVRFGDVIALAPTDLTLERVVVGCVGGRQRQR